MALLAGKITTRTEAAKNAELAKKKRETDKPAQVAPVFGGRGNDGGDRAAACDLGLAFKGQPFGGVEKVLFKKKSKFVQYCDQYGLLYS